MQTTKQISRVKANRRDFLQFRLLRAFPAIAVLLMIINAAGGQLWAQAGRGVVRGAVHDRNGAVLPNAAVRLTGADTGTTYQTVTNSDGIYIFPEVPVGTYNLAVSVPGFKQGIQSGITVSVGSTATVDMAMQVGQATESVEVISDALQIQTETSDTGTTVSSELIHDLPLNYSGLIRSPLQFATLTPGFEGSASGNPGQQVGFKLTGGPVASTDILLDGASIELASPNLQMNYGVSTDAVAEFKVQTNTFPAEFGRVGGGFVNWVSKSGTNEFHGGLYDLLRNNVFDANTWSNKHRVPQLKRGFDTQNDFGAYAGGPVRIPWLYDGRNKTFWFFSYEGFRYKSGGQRYTTVPSSAMWNGDFSSVWNNGQPWVINGTTYQPRKIYDYTTCSGANLGNPCQQFANNQIPTSRLDSMSKALIQYLPAATISTQPYQNELNTYENPVNNDLYSIKVDQSIRSNQHLSGRYYVAKMPILSEDSTWGSLYTNDFGGTNSHYVRLAYDYTLRPNLLNHLNFGFTRRFRLETSQGTIGPWQSKLGWHGGLLDNTIPGFSISQGQGGNVPAPPNNNSVFADNNYQFNEDLSWTHGKHNFKFGAEHRRQEFNVRYFNGDNGNLSYGDVLTSDGTGNQYSGYGLAAFFLGAASSGNIPAGQGDGMRSYYYGIYAQDDFKVMPKLTVNMGLRYEIPEPVFEVLCRSSQVNVTLPNAAAGGLRGAMEYQGSGTGKDGRCAPQDIFTKSFGPRIGAEYQLDRETVVRLGYGIYYEALKVSNFANSDSAGFFALNYSFPSQVNQQTPAVIPSQVAGYPGPKPPFLDPTRLNGQSPVFIESKVGRPGEIENWTLDIQRQLPGQWIVDAAYVGAHGGHLQALKHDPNVAPLAAMSKGPCLAVNITQQSSNPACAGQTPVPIPYPNFVTDFGSHATVAQALRPFPQYGDAGLDTAFDGSPFGNYTYEALQLQLNKRFGSGLSVLSNYTWSKNLTDADSDYPPEGGWNGANNGMINPYNPKAEKSYSNFDQPQILKVAYSYELPIGKGKKLLGNANTAVDSLAGGWELSGVDTYSSGTPLTVKEAGWTSGIFAGEATSSNLGDGLNARLNIVPGVNPSGYSGGGWVYGQSRKFNAAAFTVAPSYTFGNAPRLNGNVRNFANKEEDLAASKKFKLGTERTDFYFRFDAFNIFNRHTWGCFDNTYGDLNFGESTCTSGNRTMLGNFKITF